jgi:hypothetical protein
MLSFLSDKKAKSLLVDDALAEVELVVVVAFEVEAALDEVAELEVAEASRVGAGAYPCARAGAVFALARRIAGLGAGLATSDSA